MRDVVVVMPALNEIENLRWLLPEIRNALDQITRNYEVAVVLSRDANPSDVSEIQSLGGVALFRTPGNSFGDAIRTGIIQYNSKTKYLVTMDADGSHSPLSLSKLICAAEETGADIVVASRYTKGGTSANSIVLRLMSRTLNYVFRVVLRLKIDDVSTNFKVYRAIELKGIHLSCKNFDIIEELLLALKKQKKNLKVVEVPDHFYERKFGNSKRKLGPYIMSYVVTLIRMQFK
jgi:dolichol-phosphate mannosyltransferase